MIGVGGPSFDEDDIITNNDDEDLRKDPVSHIDLRVSTSSEAIARFLQLIGLFLSPHRRMLPHLFERAQRVMQVGSAHSLSSSVQKKWLLCGAPCKNKAESPQGCTYSIYPSFG
jgi:hypothetical protein